VEEVENPEYLNESVLLHSYEELEAFFRDEIHRYNEKEKREQAYHELRKAGIPVTEQGLFSCTAKGDCGAVRNFMTIGYSPKLKNDRGVSLLSVAVRNGYIDLVKVLLMYGADINAVSGDNGNSALIDAISKGYTDIAALLIKKGADLNIQSKNGQTALILAIGQHQKEISEQLIEAGADVSITDKLGMTARKYAELFNYNDILSLIPFSLCK
jgi:hypothetical protein